jgi:hypothetical protein
MRKFIDECLKDREFESQIGEKAIKNRLQTLLRELCGKIADECDFNEILKTDVLKHLRGEIKEWWVRVPIANLKLKEPITIGSVKFEDFNEGLVANNEMISNHKGGGDFSRQMSDKATFYKILNEISQQGMAWAVTTINVHEKKVIEVAREQFEAALNAIRAFAHVFYSHDLNVAFGLPYELTAGTTGFIAKSQENISIQIDRRRFFVTFELTDKILKDLKEKFHLENLSVIVGKKWDDLNTLERAIRVAYLWLGRSVIASTYAESFTQCTIAIERLLIVDGEETTTERFADRLAYLWSDESDARKSIHKLAKRLYDIRSNIVHAGFESVELHQLKQIEEIAIGALVKTNAWLDKLDSHDAFREMLHDRKME